MPTRQGSHERHLFHLQVRNSNLCQYKIFGDSESTNSMGRCFFFLLRGFELRSLRHVSAASPQRWHSSLFTWTFFSLLSNPFYWVPQSQCLSGGGYRSWAFGACVCVRVCACMCVYVRVCVGGREREREGERDGCFGMADGCRNKMISPYSSKMRPLRRVARIFYGMLDVHY